MKEYFIGLDIGTDSIGWAVTDTDYNILKFKGNAMWGIRLFDESKTAVERRNYRAGRRRLERVKNRLSLLEVLFNEEVSKKDIAFFQRLKESNLYLEDKLCKTPFSVFADSDYTDKDYHDEYPTIYHLRKELIESKSEHDVRFIFLALHHLIKHRGHFLFDNLSVDDIGSFDKIFEELKLYLKENYDLELNCNDTENLQNILKNKLLSKTKKTSAILECCAISKKTDKQLASILALLCGSSVKLQDIFADETLAEAEIKSVTFSGNYEETETNLLNILNERFELIEKLKAIYDWAILEEIRKGEKYISFAKVKTYEEHHKDLTLLKEYVKTYCPEKYKDIFKVTNDKTANYTAYSGCYKAGDTSPKHRCTQEEFCDYLRKSLPKADDEKYAEMFIKIENKTFMPKQVSKDNSVIPMQLNRAEVVAILDNAKEYLSFLNNKDNKGISVYDKILSIFDFRIPYYVGPLNKHSDKSWLIRENEQITPWNFSDVVDIDKSAEEFINNLTSKCTYLPECDVIPKNSLLYSKYMVLNELNNLKINGNKPPIELKQHIFSDLFMSKKKVTQKALKNYLKSNGYDEIDITGIDGDFKSSLKPYIELADFNLSIDDKEEIIKAITIFGDDKKLLRKRLRDYFSEKLTEDEIIKISKLKYTGWGAFSKEFLTDIKTVNKATGEYFNIIEALWSTNDNLMELFGSKYEFKEELEKSQSINEKTLKEMVEALYVSPKVKRPIYQSLKIVKEITKIKGYVPKKIFVEMARGPEEKKERKLSRKTQLMELYKACKKDSEELYKQLEKTDESEFKRDKLYLYYTQFGKCMYTGQPIPLDSLYDTNVYDIDHIYPRSKIKDDSLDNRVLVNKVVNANKDNTYPLSEVIQKNMYAHWSYLLSKGLISKKKFDRLTRNTPLLDSELADFIERQLVETRQSTKAVAGILTNLYPKPNTEIVYVKAKFVSEFRYKFDMLKCREVNDLHHAKDAYLNIVVGNVYNERCTHNRINFIKGLQNKTYSLNKMFEFDTNNAWVSGDSGSIATVKKFMNKNNILYTRYSFIQKGGLFKQNPLKKGNGQVPLKQNGPRAEIEKYGGYDKASSAFFAFVEYEDKKSNKIKALVPVDSYRLNEFNKNPNAFMQNVMELKNAKVLINCIKYNSCLSFNGCRMHLSSKSGGGMTLVYKPAMQLAIGYKWEKYIKNIVKLLEKGMEGEVTKYDGVTSDENIELFDILVNKMTNTSMEFNLGSIGTKISNRKEIFIYLPIQQQCFVILQILNIIHANVMTGDLKLIKEAGKAGASTTNSKISEIKNIKSVKLINQSVTGLFESEIDLI